MVSAFWPSARAPRVDVGGRRLAAIVFAWLMALSTGPLLAQASGERGQVGAQITSIASGEFDATDLGFGVRAAWFPIGLIGLEAEVNAFPGDFPGPPAFSRGRTEGLFGLTVGPRIGRLRPFARVRPGFVAFREAPRPFACIAIFPPPLACALAGGSTVFALDVGGGGELRMGRRTFARVDVGDRLMRYPGPALGSGRQVRQGAFTGHDLRVSVGAGLRF